MHFSILLQTLTGETSLIRQAFFSRFEETPFYVSIDTFWGVFFEKKISLSFLDNEHNSFCCKNCILRVPRNIITKAFFWGKCIHFSSVSFFEQTFSAFCQNTSNRIVETEIYVLTGNLWRKLGFLKKLLVFLFFFVRNERKIFNLLTKTFWPGCENCFQRVHSIILRSLVWKKKLDTFFLLAHWTNIFGIQSKFFQQGCQKNHLNFQSFPDCERKLFSLLSGKLPTGLPKLNSICLQERIERKNF